MKDSPRPDLLGLLERQQWLELREAIKRWPVPELAEMLAGIDRSARVVLFRAMPRAAASEVFAYLDGETKNDLLLALSEEETRRLLADLMPDDRTHLLEEMPGRATQRLLNLLAPDDRLKAVQLLGYPEESVGRLMTPDYVAVRPHWSLERALEHIRAQRKDPEVISVIHVVDQGWVLIDSLELQRFVLADPSRSVESIMDRTFVALSAYDDREAAVQAMLKYDTIALPVTDSDGVLLGIVTVDDVLDVAEEEATEDFQKAANVAPFRKPYMEMGVWSLYARRIPWLAALLVLFLAASAVIAAYEATLAAEIVLASFIPLVMGSGGNVGTQSGTLMVRAIATGELGEGTWLRTIGRELAVGGAIGVTLAFATVVVAVFRGGTDVAMIVAPAMLVVVVVANLMGVLLPLLLARLGFDPAVAGSPLITSLNDVTSLAIYFALASTWLANGS